VKRAGTILCHRHFRAFCENVNHAANVTLSSQPAAHAIHVGTRIVGVRSYLLLAAELCLQERGSTIDQFARRTGRRARPEILHGGDVAVEGVAVPMTAADLSMFQLSRVYAQGWNAARGLSAGARPNPKIVADLNPYKPGPARLRSMVEAGPLQAVVQRTTRKIVPMTAGSRQLVYWHGLLKKDHEETRCTVQAWEVIHSEGIPPDYRWHRIIDVAKPLRDGVYDLETHGEKFKVRRAKGFWLTAYPVIGV
jgi:hypothetical protein